MAPSGYQFTYQDQGSDDTLDSDADASGFTDVFSLGEDEDKTDLAAGLVSSGPAGGAIVGDRVWYDANGNGIQDAGESGASDVIVYLLDFQGNVLDSITTDGNGQYQFTDLAAGDYQLQFVAPFGYEFSPPGQGDGTNDSAPDYSGQTLVYSLSAGETATGLDAGFVLKPAFWTGEGNDGYWNNPVNWSGNTLPDADDDVLIPDWATVTLDTGDVSVGSLDVAGSLVISGGSLSVAQWAIVNGLTLSGTFGGNGDLIVTGSFTGTGGTLAGTGVFIIEDSATASLQGSLVADGRGIGNFGTVTLEPDTTLQLDNGAAFLNFGTVSVPSGTASVQGDFFQYDGSISVDSGTALVFEDGFDQSGGSVTVQGALTVVGTLQQSGGTLSLTGGTLSVTAGYNLGAAALLEGAGSITADILSDGAIDVGGTGAAGTLGVAGNYTQSGSGLLNLEFGTAGNRDLLSVSGAVTLDGTLLITTLAGFAGEQVTVIDNTGSSPISGTFAGLPEGSVFSLDGYLYQLTYVGGDGNDVVLIPVPSSGQWASYVIDFSSEFTPSDWSAAQALGAPDTFAYGDIITAWAPLPINGSLEYLTLGFATPVYATGVTVRETYGNGFVYQVDLLDVDDQLHTIWTGTDPSQPGTPVELTLAFAATPYLVKGIKIYVDTDHDLDAWEEIDAVMLHGDAGGGGGGGFAALSAPDPAAAPRPVRTASVKKPNRGPSATLRADGPVALGRAVDILFSNPRDGFRSAPASAFRYSFDFNNDGDFTDAAEVVNGTSTSARHTFSRRGWQVIHGRVLGPNGRYTDFWLRVFVS